jgi:hypothetical protein
VRLPTRITRKRGRLVVRAGPFGALRGMWRLVEGQAARPAVPGCDDRSRARRTGMGSRRAASCRRAGGRSGRVSGSDSTTAIGRRCHPPPTLEQQARVLAACLITRSKEGRRAMRSSRSSRRCACRSARRCGVRRSGRSGRQGRRACSW